MGTLKTHHVSRKGSGRSLHVGLKETLNSIGELQTEGGDLPLMEIIMGIQISRP